MELQFITRIVTSTCHSLFQPMSDCAVLLFTEAEHGYASVLPPSPGHSDKRNKQKNKKISAGGNRWICYITDNWQQGVVSPHEYATVIAFSYSFLYIDPSELSLILIAGQFTTSWKKTGIEDFSQDGCEHVIFEWHCGTANSGCHVFCRRAQLRHCLEQLKKQVPLSSDSMRNTTLNLLRRAQLHIKVDTTSFWRTSEF